MTSVYMLSSVLPMDLVSPWCWAVQNFACDSCRGFAVPPLSNSLTAGTAVSRLPTTALCVLVCVCSSVWLLPQFSRGASASGPTRTRPPFARHRSQHAHRGATRASSTHTHSHHCVCVPSCALTSPRCCAWTARAPFSPRARLVAVRLGIVCHSPCLCCACFYDLECVGAGDASAISSPAHCAPCRCIHRSTTVPTRTTTQARTTQLRVRRNEIIQTRAETHGGLAP